MKNEGSVSELTDFYRFYQLTRRGDDALIVPQNHTKIHANPVGAIHESPEKSHKNQLQSCRAGACSRRNRFMVKRGQYPFYCSFHSQRCPPDTRALPYLLWFYANFTGRCGHRPLQINYINYSFPIIYHSFFILFRCDDLGAPQTNE